MHGQGAIEVNQNFEQHRIYGLFENDTFPKFGIKTVKKSRFNGTYHGPMNFKNGFRQGKGTFKFEDEKLGEFEGQYKNDLRNGYG